MYSLEISYPPINSVVAMDSGSLYIPDSLVKLAKKYNGKWTSTDQTIGQSSAGKFIVLYISTNYDMDYALVNSFLKELPSECYVDWIQNNEMRIYSNSKNPMLQTISTTQNFSLDQKMMIEIAQSYESRCKL